MIFKESVLFVVAKVLIPLIFLFALYVQFHGDFGPGGGFQAGTIFSAGFIFYSLVFGFDKLKGIINISILEIIAVTGVVLFVGTGFLCMFLGGEFLNYSYLNADNLAGQHLGIFIVELGVFLTVFSVLLLLFFCFVDR